MAVFYISFKNYRQFIVRFKGKTWRLRERNVVIGAIALKEVCIHAGKRHLRLQFNKREINHVFVNLWGDKLRTWCARWPQKNRLIDDHYQMRAREWWGRIMCNTMLEPVLHQFIGRLVKIDFPWSKNGVLCISDPIHGPPLIKQRTFYFTEGFSVFV